MEKSIYNFALSFDDGRVVDLHDENMWVESFRIDSPQSRSERVSIDGRPGSIPISSDVGERNMTALIQVEARNYVDFDTLRDFIYEIFYPGRAFYVTRDIQPGKRIKVHIDGSFSVEYQTWEDGFFLVVMTASDPYFESTSKVSYTHNSNKFTIVNSGNVSINPRYHELAITLKGAVTSPIEIRNLTTNETWRYTGLTTENDVFKIDRIRSTKNGLSVVRQTNLKLITLAPGMNNFEIVGAINPEVTFEFRDKYR